MIFSKSFGYSLRGILYIALVQKEKAFVQADEIAQNLGVPRHFMSKILKRLVQVRLLTSVKGPYGGFALHEGTLDKPVYALIEVTDGLSGFQNCVLRFHHCNVAHPCPLHYKIEEIVQRLKDVLNKNTIGDLLQPENKDFLQSIATDDPTPMEQNPTLFNSQD